MDDNKHKYNNRKELQVMNEERLKRFEKMMKENQKNSLSQRFLQRIKDYAGTPAMKEVADGIFVPYEESPMDPNYMDELRKNGTLVEIPPFD